MPIREYICKDCGHIFENFERGDEDKPTQCTQCDSGKIERLLSAHGGYSISGSNGASVRPRKAGSFKRHR